MNYLYLSLGVIALIMQAGFYFVLVASTVNGEGGNPGFMNFFIYALPGLCILAGIFMIIGFFQHSEYIYRWILLPIPLAVLFIILRLNA